jgi:hypothetical protein
MSQQLTPTDYASNMTYAAAKEVFKLLLAEGANLHTCSAVGNRFRLVIGTAYKDAAEEMSKAMISNQSDSSLSDDNPFLESEQ